jgi:hypothetical protein
VLNHLVYLLFERAGAEELVHLHILALPDAEGAVGRLVLDRRVPPAVEVEDVIRGREVEARAARFEREQEDVRVGDEVLSYNQTTKQFEYKPVPWLYERYSEEVFEVSVAGEDAPIGVSPEHPFYVRLHRARDGLGGDDEPPDEGQWKKVEDLRPGDELLRADGTWAAVVGVRRREGGAKLYNFEVADNHNYFVGELGTLVHNKCKYNRNNGTLDRETTKVLWENLRKDQVRDYEVHHLIGVRTAKDFKVMRKAASLGYDINRKTNLIDLPATEDLSLRTGKPYHGGKHNSSYVEHVREKLTNLQDRYDAGEIPDSELLKRINRVERQIRNDLLEDRIRLQKNDPRP